jgi:hypothetical protein
MNELSSANLEALSSRNAGRLDPHLLRPRMRVNCAVQDPISDRRAHRSTTYVALLKEASGQVTGTVRLEPWPGDCR